MAYNQILQNMIEGVKTIARTDLILTDPEGNVAAATCNETEKYLDSMIAFAGSSAEIQMAQGCQYYKIMDGSSLEYIMLLKGDSEDLYTIGKLVAFQVQNLLSAYKERYDKENFIKNILMDNMLLVDIQNKARKLRVDIEAQRVVIVIETSMTRDNASMEIIKNYCAGRTKDIVTAVDENLIILVRELNRKETYEDLFTDSMEIVELLNAEAMINARVAIGTMIDNIKDISKSFKEAKMALDVGKIFYEEKKVIAYDHLGIGRLIYQLSLPLCSMFMNEIFPDTALEDFDDETIVTIDRFFSNNLNISETARQLYIHRNTLVYRLDKVHKATGLDLRSFDDAITFKIALMVSRYMKFLENKNDL